METSPGNDDSTKNIEKIIKLTKKRKVKRGQWRHSGQQQQQQQQKTSRLAN